MGKLINVVASHVLEVGLRQRPAEDATRAGHGGAREASQACRTPTGGALAICYSLRTALHSAHGKGAPAARYIGPPIAPLFAHDNLPILPGHHRALADWREQVHAMLQGLQGQLQACTDAHLKAQQAVNHTESAGEGEPRIAPAIQAEAFPGRLG